MRNTKDMIDDKVVKMIDTLYKLFKKAVLDALREHFAEVTSEKNAKALQKKLNDNAPHKYYTINFDQVITHAIAEGGPAYELMIANDPIAEYLPKDERIVLRHPKDPDRIGVVAYTFCPVNYRSNGVVRFLNSNQTETTNEGQRAQLARLNR